MARSRNHCGSGNTTARSDRIVEPRASINNKKYWVVHDSALMANLHRRQQWDVLGSARKVADILVRREPDSHASPQHQISRKSVQSEPRWYVRTDMTKLIGAFMRLRERA